MELFHLCITMKTNFFFNESNNSQDATTEDNTEFPWSTYYNETVYYILQDLFCPMMWQDDILQHFSLQYLISCKFEKWQNFNLKINTILGIRAWNKVLS